MNTNANDPVEKMNSNVQEERKRMMWKDGVAANPHSSTPSHEDVSPVRVAEDVVANKENNRAKKNRKNKQKRSSPPTTTRIPSIPADSTSPPLTETGKVSVPVVSESETNTIMDTTKTLAKEASCTSSSISPVRNVPEEKEDSLSIAVVSIVDSGDENQQDEGGNGSSSAGTNVVQEDVGTAASVTTKTSDSNTAATTTNNGQKKKKKKYSKWNRRNKNRSKNSKKSPTRSVTPEKVIDSPEEEADVAVEGNTIPPTNEIPNESKNHVLKKPSTHDHHVDDDLSTVVKDSDSTVAESEVDSTVTTNAAGKAILEQLSSSTTTTTTMMTGTTTMTTTTSHCSGPYSPVPTSTGTSYIEENFDCTPIPCTEELHLNGISQMNNMVTGGREHGQDHFDVSCIDFCMEHGHEQYCMDHVLQPPNSPNDSSNDSSSFGYPMPSRQQPHHQMNFVPSLDGQAPLPPPASFGSYGGHPLPYMPMPIPLGPDGMPLMYHGPPPPSTHGPTPMPNYGMDPTLSFPYSHPPPPLPLSSSPPSHPNHDMMAYYPMSMPPMGMPNGTPTSSPPPLNASCTHAKMKYEQVSVNGCTFFQPVLDTGLDDKDNGAQGSDDPNGVVEDTKKKNGKGKQMKKRKYKKKKGKASIKKSQSNDVNDANDVIKSTTEPTVVVTE